MSIVGLTAYPRFPELVLRHASSAISGIAARHTIHNFTGQPCGKPAAFLAAQGSDRLAQRTGNRPKPFIELARETTAARFESRGSPEAVSTIRPIASHAASSILDALSRRHE
ncbi:hypothetical protein [Burkholderia sp. Bp8963]|uniref:hypothetical protein n=1 Tax=Burkholderia sp. Bp8963 TaxID=2184547 RepID=UPI000F5B6544|nr:hypothetical protein [Burkholderia sp. Bp8963]